MAKGGMRILVVSFHIINSWSMCVEYPILLVVLFFNWSLVHMLLTGSSFFCVVFIFSTLTFNGLYCYSVFKFPICILHLVSFFLSCLPGQVIIELAPQQCTNSFPVQKVRLTSVANAPLSFWEFNHLLNDFTALVTTYDSSVNFLASWISCSASLLISYGHFQCCVVPRIHNCMAMYACWAYMPDQ